MTCIITLRVSTIKIPAIIAYTISCAYKSKIFDKIVVSTDSKKYASIAEYYGASVPFLRPKEISGDNSPDIDWVSFTLKNLKEKYDCFSILRPTSPFRNPNMIVKAWDLFKSQKDIDSIRAVEKCSQHPAKMWTINEIGLLKNIMPGSNKSVPWHSSQYSNLPKVYTQNASLEIAWTEVALKKNSISGDRILPFHTNDIEGFDINKPQDWVYANYLLKYKKIAKIKIDKEPFK